MKITPNEHVTFRRLGDRMVLIHLQTNDIFDLNETSARLWELLGEHGDVEQILTVLAEEFDVDPQQLQRETSATLKEFARWDLIAGYDGS
ncbi:MAG TPA: PqqD family protein [Sporichthya sp.]|nr:PqqD family protein [Sporichthya sp.]